MRGAPASTPAGPFCGPRPISSSLTKRLHNNLHGDRGDGGPLGDAQRDLYERTMASSARHLCPLIQKGDIVFLHDPQTAGLARAVRATGASVVWRCHVGTDQPDECARRAWEFLVPYVTLADAYIFSRTAYRWEMLDSERTWVIPPCIDPFSPKNDELDQGTVEGIVGEIGLGHAPSPHLPTFTRSDGSPARVERQATVLQEERLPERAPVVAQISRWDRLKDPRGVLTCFYRHVAGESLHLVLAGPESASVSDDPEGASVWREVGRAWGDLPERIRRRVHLVSLPMEDVDENAAMVNALQRRADIVVQKSLAEGFGLTVAEAMWKRRPVIGTRVGGIQDQIVDGVSGLLIDDPQDLEALGRAIVTLEEDRARAAEIGEQAHQRARERFLAANRLAEYVDLLADLGPAGDV